MVEKQKTIKKELNFSGIGVHSGVATSVFLKPAQSNQGIVFQHNLHPEEPIVLGEVIPEVAMHATVLKQKSWAISTIEHLLAAVTALGIDNLIIQVNGPEIPIIDGSALPFAQAIELGGIVEQDSQKKKLYPKGELSFGDQQGRMIQLMPPKDDNSKYLFIEYEGDGSYPSLKKKSFIKERICSKNFIENIAPARTYGFLNQMEFLRSHGLARGANLGNTIVIGEGEFINELRFPDECVRHKMLDLIGDLGTLGYPLVGQIKARRTGHSFNRKVVEHFITNPSSWILE